jgi:hypothetical protein
MPQDLVRVRVNGYEKNVGRAYAEAHDLEVLDEPTRDRAGALRPTTRKGGRRAKPKTTVTQEAAKKKAAVTESAPTEKEQTR